MTELAVLETTNNMMPALTIHEAADRYNALVEFTKSVMKNGKDYGEIPGTAKPTLLKPGAEKLCTLFGFVPKFIELEGTADFTEGLIFYRYRCELYRHGELAGEGVGSCNSKEKKYRYTWISTTQKPSKEDAEHLKMLGVGRWRKIKNAWVWQE